MNVFKINDDDDDDDDDDALADAIHTVELGVFKESPSHQSDIL